MRRIIASLTLTLVVAAMWGGAPSPGRASCAYTASLTEVAEEPGTAVFTGWADHGIAGSQDLVFVVDRWFHGPHEARAVRLLGSTAVLDGEQASGPVEVVMAEVVAGDAISLTRDEPVLMVADWSPASRAFGVRFCTVAGVPLGSPEGRAALAEAEGAFGTGRPAADLPDTSTLAPAGGSIDAMVPVLPEWWLPALALALAVSVELVVRRLALR